MINSVARASVIVATRGDRPAELRECLRLIRAQTTSEDEIIVVDSASRDAELVQRLAREAGAKYLRTHLGGSARARNVGIDNARGEIMAFTDDDAYVCDGWLDALVDGFRDSSVSAVVGPVYVLGSESEYLFSFPDFDPGRDVVRFNRESRDWFLHARCGAIGSGANIAVRRAAFVRHGGFRESLGSGAPIGGDENYCLLTLIENGETVLNEPSAAVHHLRQPDDRLHDLRGRNVAYYFYLLLTRPRIRKPLLAHAFSRRPHAVQGTASPFSSMDVVRAFARAPGLVFSALIIDRAQQPVRQTRASETADRTHSERTATHLPKSALRLSAQSLPSRSASSMDP